MDGIAEKVHRAIFVNRAVMAMTTSSTALQPAPQTASAAINAAANKIQTFSFHFNACKSFCSSLHFFNRQRKRAYKIINIILFLYYNPSAAQVNRILRNYYMNSNKNRDSARALIYGVLFYCNGLVFSETISPHLSA
jgi:hypothetical protein